MCSGRVDLGFIFRAFSNGMDGVFIGGCHLGECNYVTHGNFHALNTVLLAKQIMRHIGLDPDRLTIEFMSGGEGQLYTEVVDKFTKQVTDLGPLGVKEGLEKSELKAKIAEITKLIPYIKVVKRKKLESKIEARDLFSFEEIEEMFSQVASYWIDPAKCKACGTCARRCPVEAIEGAKKQVHVIDQDKCIKCGTCYSACPTKFSAVTEIVGEAVPPPLPADQRDIA